MNFRDHKNVFSYVFGFIFFCFIAIAITYPLINNLTTHVSSFGDEMIIAWIQNFVINNPFTFQANIFYPYQNSLAFSDLFLTSSIVSAMPLYILKEPIVAFNFTFISSLALLGFSIFSLSFYLTKNILASIIGGLLVVFSPAVLDKHVHLQILAIYFVPFTMLFFFHFVKTEKTKFLLISLLFFVLQTANSFLPGYFIVFFYLISIFFLGLWKRKKLRNLINIKNVLSVFLALIILVPIAKPYFDVSRVFDYKRDIRDSIHFAIQPEDMLVAHKTSKLQKPLDEFFANKNYSDNTSIKPGFLGLAFSVLSILFIFFFIKIFRKQNFELNTIFTTGIVGLITSLGPALHFGRSTIHEPFPIVLPYALFYFILPGFAGFRNSARWEMLFIICMAVGISIMLAYFYKKTSFHLKIIVSAIIILIIILEFNYPFSYVEVPQKKDFPKAYSYLSEKGGSSVLLPICSWNGVCANEEFLRLYYSTEGFPKITNGISGFSPPSWEKWVENINKTFPSTKSIQLIKEKNIDYIVFEKDLFEVYFEEKSDDALEFLTNSPELTLDAQFDNTYIFKFSNENSIY